MSDQAELESLLRRVREGAPLGAVVDDAESIWRASGRGEPPRRYLARVSRPEAIRMLEAMIQTAATPAVHVGPGSAEDRARAALRAIDQWAVVGRRSPDADARWIEWADALGGLAGRAVPASVEQRRAGYQQLALALGGRGDLGEALAAAGIYIVGDRISEEDRRGDAWLFQTADGPRLVAELAQAGPPRRAWPLAGLALGAGLVGAWWFRRRT